MKTKIIYISGGEVFNMADIRAAFEEVRATLGLGTDTVMFGVPVDADDAALGTADAPTETVETDTPVDMPAEIIPVAPMAMPDVDIIPEPADEPVPDPVVVPVDIPADEPVDTPEIVADVPTEVIPDVAAVTDAAPAPKKSRRGRRPRAVVQEVVVEEAPVVTEMPESSEVAESVSDKVVPILSVLAAHDGGDIDDALRADDTLAAPVESPADASDNTAQITTVSISDIGTDARETIVEMISDDAPDVDDTEKTLEQLLEKMTPLGEDNLDIHADVVADTPAPIQMDDAPLELDDGDATLTQLATEFANSADKIETEAGPARGKIGKLKNILPFKKVKREDPSLMGDLFGWAGIAANDDEFSIPGFFTTAAAKK